ncbi:MAG: SUKH-4 family immunity protein [Aggregatilineales bacterium]
MSTHPSNQNNLQIGKFHDPYMDTTYDGLLLLNPFSGQVSSYWKASGRTQFVNSNIIQMLYFLSVYEQHKPEIDELGEILGDLKTHLKREERIEINKKATKSIQDLLSKIESKFRQADPNVFQYEDSFWQLWLTE